MEHDYSKNLKGRSNDACIVCLVVFIYIITTDSFEVLLSHVLFLAVGYFPCRCPIVPYHLHYIYAFAGQGNAHFLGCCITSGAENTLYIIEQDTAVLWYVV